MKVRARWRMIEEHRTLKCFGRKKYLKYNLILFVSLTYIKRKYLPGEFAQRDMFCRQM